MKKKGNFDLSRRKFFFLEWKRCLFDKSADIVTPPAVGEAES